MTASPLTPRATGVRLRQVPALVRPLACAVRWQPLVGAAALAAVLLVLKADDLGEQGTAVLVLRAVAALLAVGAAFLLDDGATDTLAASPSTLAWRRGHRLVMLVALAGVAWLLAVLAVRSQGADPPIAGLTLELAALLGLAIAVAAGITRWAHTAEPGPMAAPFVFGAILSATRLPERWAVVVGPGPAWEPAHQRWALLLAVSLVLLIACNRDPAHRWSWPLQLRRKRTTPDLSA